MLNLWYIDETSQIQHAIERTFCMRRFRICYDVFILIIAALVLFGSGTSNPLAFAYWISIVVFGIYDLILRLCFRKPKGSLIFRLLPCLIGLCMIVSGVAKLDDYLLLLGLLFEGGEDTEEQPNWPSHTTADDSYEDNWC